MQPSRNTSQAQNMPRSTEGKRFELSDEQPGFYEITQAQWIAEVASARNSESRSVADAKDLFVPRSISPLQLCKDNETTNIQDWSMQDQITPTKKKKQQPRYGDYSEDVTLRVNHLRLQSPIKLASVGMFPSSSSTKPYSHQGSRGQDDHTSRTSRSSTRTSSSPRRRLFGASTYRIQKSSSRHRKSARAAARSETSESESGDFTSTSSTETTDIVMEDMPELSGGETYTSDGDPDEYLQHYEELRKYLMKQRAKREKEEMLKSDGVGKGGRPYRKSISLIKFEPATPAKQTTRMSDRHDVTPVVVVDVDHIIEDCIVVQPRTPKTPQPAGRNIRDHHRRTYRRTQ